MPLKGFVMKKVVLCLLAVVLAILAQAQYMQPGAEQHWNCPGPLLHSGAQVSDRIDLRATEGNSPDVRPEGKEVPCGVQPTATPAEPKDDRSSDAIRKVPETRTLAGVELQPGSPRP